MAGADVRGARPSAARFNTDVVTLGESMAALQCAGSLSLGDPVTVTVAGAESNVAIGLARLGHGAAFVGGVGADALGELVRRTLRAENVDVSALRTVENRPTGIISFDRPVAAITSVDYFRRGSAGSVCDRSDIVAVGAASARIAHFSGVTAALSDEAPAHVTAAVAAARASGALISFDLNYRTKLWSREKAAEALGPLARSADIVIASESEIGLLADDQAAGVDELAMAFTTSSGAELVVKRGEFGATAFIGAERFDQAALRANVVETVGAGDAFSAGYLSAVLDGLDIPGRLRRGCALGAFAVSHRGDWEGLPTRSQLALVGVSTAEALR